MQKIGDARQFWSGVLFLAIGASALWYMPRPIGSVISMGPGYFPMLLGVGLLVVGAISLVSGWRSQETGGIDRVSLVPTFFIISGIVLMALLIDRVGLAISLFFMIFGTCYARVLKHPVEVFAIYLAVLALTWFVFIYLTQVPIQLFW